MKKIISFSLYGNNPKYCQGAIENAKLCPIIYPGWIMRLYYDYTVPKHYIDELKKLDVELYDMTNKEIPNFGVFWRFFVNDDPQVERFIVRDTDSRLNKREKDAVDEWISSNKSLHIMRDHPQHGVLILAGTWGLKSDKNLNMKNEILDFLKDKEYYRYGDDQIFLIKIHRRYKLDTICHDDFFDFPNNKPFPTERINYEFIGQVFDENNNTILEHQNQLIKYLNYEN